MPKTKFQEQCERGAPIEEAFDEVKKHIKSLGENSS